MTTPSHRHGDDAGDDAGGMRHGMLAMALCCIPMVAIFALVLLDVI